MVTAKSQAKWRDRKAKGLVKFIPCPLCGKPCRVDSTRSPLHTLCWRKTDEGRSYMREMQKKSRAKKSKAIYPHSK